MSTELEPLDQIEKHLINFPLLCVLLCVAMCVAGDHDHPLLWQVTRVFRVERKRVPKPVAARKQWAKFGDASRDVQGPDPATTKIADDVFITLTINSTVSHSQHHLRRKLSSEQKPKLGTGFFGP